MACETLIEGKYICILCVEENMYSILNYFSWHLTNFAMKWKGAVLSLHTQTAQIPTAYTIPKQPSCH